MKSLTNFDIKRPALSGCSFANLWNGMCQVRSKGAIDVGLQCAEIQFNELKSKQHQLMKLFAQVD